MVHENRIRIAEFADEEPVQFGGQISRRVPTARERVDQVDAVLHSLTGGASGDRAAAIAVNREAERLGGRFVLVRVVIELLMPRGSVGGARALKVPSAEHT